MAEETEPNQDEINAVKSMIERTGMFDQDVPGESSTPTEDVEGESSAPQEEPDEGPEPEDEENRIPLSRLNEEISKRKAAESRIASLEAEKGQESRLEIAKQAIAEAEKPDGFDGWEVDDKIAYLAEVAASKVVEARLGASEKEIRELAAERAASRDLGIDLTSAQLAAFSKVRADSPGLTDPEALAITQTRHPDLFKASGGRQTPSHHVSPPSRGESPRRKPPDRRAEAMRRLREASPQDRDAAGAAALNEILFKRE